MSLNGRMVNSGDPRIFVVEGRRGQLALIAHGGFGPDQDTYDDHIDPPGDRALDRPQPAHPHHEA